MSRSVLTLVLAAVGACSSPNAREAKEGGPVTENGGETGCMPPEGDFLSQCAPTYDEELRKLTGECERIPSQALRCGRYLVLNQPANYGAGKFCFYDAETKQRLAYAYCSDTQQAGCRSAYCRVMGEQIDVACTAETLRLRETFSSMCEADGGAAVDAGVAADARDAASDGSQD